jgi:hypothetical protein
MDPKALRDRLRLGRDAHPGALLATDEPDGVRLTEVATGKTLRLEAGEVLDVQSQANAQTGSEYLVLVRDGRPQLALADAGFVFALDTRNTGPLPSAPPVMSFRDFRRLYEHLRHLVERAESRLEALDTLQILIASLDGARAAGLATQVEEGELEAVLRIVEAGP